MSEELSGSGSGAEYPQQASFTDESGVVREFTILKDPRIAAIEYLQNQGLVAEWTADDNLVPVKGARVTKSRTAVLRSVAVEDDSKET